MDSLGQCLNIAASFEWTLTKLNSVNRDAVSCAISYIQEKVERDKVSTESANDIRALMSLGHLIAI